MNSKKEREEAYLNAVKAMYPAFPAGKVEPDETPDFRVVGDHSTTGMEMVDYIRGQGAEDGSPMRRNEKLRHQVARQAKAIFEEKDHVSLMVHFTWDDTRQLEGSRVGNYAASAAAVVADNIPGEVYKKITKWGYELEGNPLQKVLRCIDIRRLKPESPSRWGPIEAGFIGIEVGDLQDLLTSKEHKIAAYLKNCDSVWLIIVADAQHLSSMGELSDEVLSHHFETSFERVLFYTGESRSVTELPIARK